MTSSQGARRVGPYRILHSTPICETTSFKVREDRVSLHDQPEESVNVITLRPTVTVLPLEEEGSVYLIRRFRYATAEESLEAIGGTIESGERPEQAGLRVLGAEAGLVASEWVDLGLLQPLPAIMHAPNHLFLARTLSKLRRQTVDSTRTEVEDLPFAEAVKLALGSQITHGTTCVLLLKTQQFLDQSSRRGPG